MAPDRTEEVIAATADWLGLRDAGLLRGQAFVGGQWCDADDGSRVAVTNPATGMVIAHVPCMGAAETRRAIAAAEAAWPDWQRRTAKERAAILRCWFDLMMANQEDLARILTAEQGKPLAEARGEIAYAANFLEWFGEEGKRADGDVLPVHRPGTRGLVLKQPVGVSAAITPWNFPAGMITRKAGPALAAGCPMVVKPASATPLSALALAVLARRAGVPDGVLSIVTGSAGGVGGELVSNPAVRKLSFTGSTEIGKLLLAQCADTVKKVSMELGGNAPFIVFDDADIDAAVAGAMASKFRNAGQTCVCADRFYVQHGIHDAFAQRLAEAVGDLVVGNGLTDGVALGPLIDGAAVAQMESGIAEAVAGGAHIAAGGRRHALGGNYFEPTVLTGVTPAMRVVAAEIFGPIAPLMTFRDEADVIRAANDTPYGLAAYFYTRDIGRVWRVAEALEYGMVGINEGVISSEGVPFGGLKESGLGREGGRYGIEDYLEVKYLLMGGLGQP